MKIPEAGYIIGNNFRSSGVIRDERMTLWISEDQRNEHLMQEVEKGDKGQAHHF